MIGINTNMQCNRIDAINFFTRVQHNEVCPTCNGKGYIVRKEPYHTAEPGWFYDQPIDGRMKCPTCDGDGVIPS